MSTTSMTGKYASPAFGEEPMLEVKDTGVIWSAIIGGTITALAVMLLLAPLGASLGYSRISPWNTMDGAQKTLTFMSVAWLIIVQWLSSGLGGYLTGRLRTGWAGAHMHEVFFRDTAHGFLTWALSTLVGVLLLAAGLMHAADHHAPKFGGGRATMGYTAEFSAVNKLFRTDQATSDVTDQDRTDSWMILSAEADGVPVPEADKAYLVHRVQARTGLSADEAQKRVNDTLAHFAETKKAEHTAMTTAGIFVFLSMWVGAFIASAAGALGGLHRDTHYQHGRLSAE